MSEAEEYVKYLGGITLEYKSQKHFIERLKDYDQWKETRREGKYDLSPASLEKFLRGFDASRVEVNRRVDELEKWVRELQNHRHIMTQPDTCFDVIRDEPAEGGE